MGLQENRRTGVSAGHWRAGAERPLLGAAAGGRARDGGTHQQSAAHCASARGRVPGPTAPRSRPVPGRAWRRPPGQAVPARSLPTVTCTPGPAHALPTLSLRFLRTQLRPPREILSLSVRWVSLGPWSGARECVAAWAGITRSCGRGASAGFPDTPYSGDPPPPSHTGISAALSLAPGSQPCSRFSDLFVFPTGTSGSRASSGVGVERSGLCPE